jgi:hypothetical protein
MRLIDVMTDTLDQVNRRSFEGDRLKLSIGVPLSQLIQSTSVCPNHKVVSEGASEGRSRLHPLVSSQAHHRRDNGGMSTTTDVDLVHKGALTLEGVVDDIGSAKLTELLDQHYEETRSASLQGCVAGGGGIIIATRFGDTKQLHHVRAPGSARNQLTFAREPVVSATCNPVNDTFVYLKDTGGDENFHLYLRSPTQLATCVSMHGADEIDVDAAVGDVDFAATSSGKQGAVKWNNAGSCFAYYSTRRNGKDWDIYVCTPTLASPSSSSSSAIAITYTTRLVACPGGSCHPVAWAADDSALLIRRYHSIMKSELLLLPLSLSGSGGGGGGCGAFESFPPLLLTPPHTGEACDVAYGADAVFLPPSLSSTSSSTILTSFLIATNFGSDVKTLTLVTVPATTTTTTSTPVECAHIDVTPSLTWPVTSLAASADRRFVALLANEDGFNAMYLLDTAAAATAAAAASAGSDSEAEITATLTTSAATATAAALRRVQLPPQLSGVLSGLCAIAPPPTSESSSSSASSSTSLSSSTSSSSSSSTSSALASSVSFYSFALTCSNARSNGDIYSVTMDVDGDVGVAVELSDVADADVDVADADVAITVDTVDVDNARKTGVVGFVPGVRVVSVERWTESECGGLPIHSNVLPSLFRFPTFDFEDAAATRRRHIPAFLFMPPSSSASTSTSSSSLLSSSSSSSASSSTAAKKLPVMICIHGGPESQWRPSFKPMVQFYVRELGVAIVAPNVRGSSGCRWCECACDIQLCSLLCCSLGRVQALL